jgi:hypothetical protein
VSGLAIVVDVMDNETSAKGIVLSGGVDVVSRDGRPHANRFISADERRSTS